MPSIDAVVDRPPEVVQKAPEAPKAVEKPKEIGRVEQQVVASIDSSRDTSKPDTPVQDPDATLAEILKINTGEQPGAEMQDKKPEQKGSLPNLASAEQSYIQENPKMAGLADRYTDSRTDAGEVQSAIDQYVSGVGIEHATPPEITGKSFDQEARKVIGEQVQAQIDRLFESEQGRKNPEKHASVTWEAQRYLDLMSQAQAEGDVSQDVSAQAILAVVEGNVWKLAFQDRVASENLLGDHGIRHLVDHNTKVSEAIADELVKNGQPVKAIDRLIMHQTMVDHDLGYTTAPVREGVNAGSFSADRGHNVLSAKIVRQRAESDSDPLSRVYTEKQIAVLHEAILHHDSSTVDLQIGEASDEARAENIYSIIHTADNTHAFEDKLPELLYSRPDTLRVMRLMKTAGEIGDDVALGGLQTQLVEGIQKDESISVDDRDALVQAAKSLTKDSYKFAVGRICGNKPEFTLDTSGKLTIEVTESAIHQEAVGLYGQESYDQLRKFVADLTGTEKKQVDLNQDSIVSQNGKMEIRLKLGEGKAQEASDYQKQIESLIAEPAFQEFILGTENRAGDGRLSAEQALLQKVHDTAIEGSEEKATYATGLSRIKEQRSVNLREYMAKGGK